MGSLVARATQEDIEDLAELWGVDEDDIRDLAREWHVPILELEAEAERRAEAETTREIADEERDEPEEESSEVLDDDDVTDLADMWGVDEADVEALAEEIDLAPDEMTKDEIRDYIDDLYDVLIDEGWELDVSDLWDMYYGYVPGAA